MSAVKWAGNENLTFLWILLGDLKYELPTYDSYITIPDQKLEQLSKIITERSVKHFSSVNQGLLAFLFRLKDLGFYTYEADQDSSGFKFYTFKLTDKGFEHAQDLICSAEFPKDDEENIIRELSGLNKEIKDLRSICASGYEAIKYAGRKRYERS